MRETILIALGAASAAAAWNVAESLRLSLSGEITHVGRDFAWMAPAAALLLWFAAALPAGFIARLLPRRRALWLATTGFFSLAALSILIPTRSWRATRWPPCRWALGSPWHAW